MDVSIAPYSYFDFYGETLNAKGLMARRLAERPVIYVSPDKLKPEKGEQLRDYLQKQFS